MKLHTVIDLESVIRDYVLEPKPRVANDCTSEFTHMFENAEIFSCQQLCHGDFIEYLRASCAVGPKTPCSNDQFIGLSQRPVASRCESRVF